MDWQFLVSTGLGLVLGILPFVAKEPPSWLKWPSFSIGLLLVLWGLIALGYPRIPIAPTLVFIASCAVAVGR